MIILHIPIPIWPVLLWILIGLLTLKVAEAEEGVPLMDLEDMEFDEIARYIIVILSGPIAAIIAMKEADLFDNVINNINCYFVERKERKEEQKRVYEENKRRSSKPGMFEW